MTGSTVLVMSTTPTLVHNQIDMEYVEIISDDAYLFYIVIHFLFINRRYNKLSKKTKTNTQ